ncbi:MAG: hypothetical protein HN837_07975 [Chloroflexi bacterium]|jgi:signal transduction histidine kinase|nr:hypothetical protein [Chloroflexota bacterium]MBT7290408.1 hypothetical protein [Chloroflexota bacterium]
MVEERTGELTEVHDKLMRSEKLAVINNSTYYLRMKMVIGDAKVARHMEILEREVFRSSGIIDGLLDFARSREPKINQARIDQIVDAVLERIKWPENVQLVRKDDGLPFIDVDIEQIGRVFSNIINNALQSMPDGGALNIGASIDDGFVSIKITDTGIGVSMKNIDKIFEPLFTTRSGVGGTGIGLAICKSIVDAHRGSIEVKSSEGKGTTFTIKFPLNQK